MGTSTPTVFVFEGYRVGLLVGLRFTIRLRSVSVTHPRTQHALALGHLAALY